MKPSGIKILAQESYETQQGDDHVDIVSDNRSAHSAEAAAENIKALHQEWVQGCCVAKPDQMHLSLTFPIRESSHGGGRFSAELELETTACESQNPLRSKCKLSIAVIAHDADILHDILSNLTQIYPNGITLGGEHRSVS